MMIIKMMIIKMMTMLKMIGLVMILETMVECRKHIGLKKVSTQSHMNTLMYASICINIYLSNNLIYLSLS